MSKESFLKELLGRMSVEEKAGQLNLLTGTMDATGAQHSDDLLEKIKSSRCGGVFNVYTPSATRELQEIAIGSPNGIPLLFGYDVIHGHRTTFPIPLGMSCSWNPDLIRECARAAAAEASADGLHWVFSPMVDISQDARWGRVAEGSGEDPWLGSQIAAAMVEGYQGNDLTSPHAVAACVKHMALYGASKAGRDYNTVDMSRREMENTYFPPYRAAVDAGARTVMASFNEVDGIPATGNRWLLTDILREEWGFRGMIATDYTAVIEMKNHGTCGTDADAASLALHAGVDMDMVSGIFEKDLPSLVANGRVHLSTLDEAVMRVLELKWDLGLFDDPFARCDEARASQTHLSAAHRELARQAAQESIVLLKNDDDLLPLRDQKTIAVIGPLADSPRDLLGCWIAAGNQTDAQSILQGISGTTDRTILYQKGCEIEEASPQLLTDAVNAAQEADAVILVLGESWNMNGEAASRTDIRLPEAQRELAEAIATTGKPCVLITLSGRPLELTREDSLFSTLLHVWAPGMEGAAAISDILFGKAAPIGKLTMGFPRHVGQLPMTYREKPTGRPYSATDPYTTRYLDRSNEPLFPFGHGLTYGKIQILQVAADQEQIGWGEKQTLRVQVTNPGESPVTETLQLYLRDPVATYTRPVKELRGYTRITLSPGEVREVIFSIGNEELQFPGRDFQPVVEPGEFIAMIGTSSAELHPVSFRLTRSPE